jgi:hypothetical protein
LRVADEAVEDVEDALLLAMGRRIEGLPALHHGLVAEDVGELGVGDEGDAEGAGDLSATSMEGVISPRS